MEVGCGIFVVGLVVLVLGMSGYMVFWCYFDSYFVFDVFQICIFLEGEIVCFVVGCLMYLQIDKMEQVIRMMEECWVSQDLFVNVEVDFEFYGIIVLVCLNVMLKVFYQMVCD